MLDTPFRFEEELTSEEFQKLGQLSLRWSHTEHIIGNCLKVMLRLTDEEAVAMIFPLPVERRLDKIKELSALTPLNSDAQAAFDELRDVMRGIQYVRNNVIHAIVINHPDHGQLFHLRSKGRSLRKAQIFSCEELTNYAAHAALSLRYALGLKGSPGERFPLPDRPEIPEVLRELIPVRKQGDGQHRSPPPPSRG